MPTGTVKWYNNEKGFGFIESDGGGPDHMVHYSDIESSGFKELYEGQRLSFESEDGPKGPKAKQLKLV